MERFSYVLRCVVQPGFHAESRLAALISFAQRSQIDEIMFFLNCEELNTGHLSPAETRQWLDTLYKCRQACLDAGIRFSLNPWTTLLHEDRGRTLKSGQTFATMVDMTGRQAQAVACPLDETFLSYLTELYSQYASLEPHTLWIEDDFRLHGHAPLQWGGCFCEHHMEQYCARLGRTVSREDFYSHLLTGEDDCRQAWMDVSRKTMVDLAARLSQKVHAVSPKTRMALMCSNPIVHAAEGRDWYGIVSALGEGAVVRPHLPAYEEIPAKDYLWHFCCASRLTAAFTEQAAISLWPELENFPYSRFAKSHRFSRLQILLSLAINANGITMNIVDMIGNGVRSNESIDQMLTQIHPLLDRFSGKLPVTAQQGVLVPCCETSGYTIRPCTPKSMIDLYPGETYFASLLSAYGIANRITPHIPQGTGQVIAISGQYLRNLAPAERCQLFHGNRILLDGEAALTLYLLGQGFLAGIQNAYIEQRQDRAYEEFTGMKILGITDPRITAQHHTCGEYICITYDATAHPLSWLYTYRGEKIGPGIVQRDNVLILPQSRRWQPSFQHLNPFTMEIVKDFLRNSVPMLEESCNQLLLTYDLPTGQMLFAANCTNDDVPYLLLSGLDAEQVRCFSTQDPEGKIVSHYHRADGVLVIEEPIQAMDAKLFALDNIITL